jgi:hypothetical protein
MTLAALTLLAQSTGALAAVAVAPPSRVPFAVGERLEYQGKSGILPLGTAVLSVDGIEQVSGSPHWRFSFTTQVSVPLYKNTTMLASWTGVEDFISRRFTKDILENGKRRVEEFRIFPDSGFFRRNTNAPKATPREPLDDVAFFYWIRTIPLEVGRTYTFTNYFRDEHNPVTVRVLKRERKEMPDGSKVQSLVLHPIVDEPNGMFSRKSEARLWLTDDARRLPVQIQSRYVFGEVKLVLKSITEGGAGG